MHLHFDCLKAEVDSRDLSTVSCDTDEISQPAICLKMSVRLVEGASTSMARRFFVDLLSTHGPKELIEFPR